MAKLNDDDRKLLAEAERIRDEIIAGIPQYGPSASCKLCRRHANILEGENPFDAIDRHMKRHPEYKAWKATWDMTRHISLTDSMHDHDCKPGPCNCACGCNTYLGCTQWGGICTSCHMQALRGSDDGKIHG